MNARPPMPVVLLGPPGAGKSTVGAALARALDVPFFDVDTMVARAAQKSVSEIFLDEGEVGFRIREHHALIEAIEGSVSSVVAPGAGAITVEMTRRRLSSRTIPIALDVDDETLRTRLANGEGRPLLQVSDDGSRVGAAPDVVTRVRALDAERAPWRDALARCHVDGNGAVDDVVADIVRRLRAPQNNFYRMPSVTERLPDDVFIGALGEMIDVAIAPFSRAAASVIVDEHVAEDVRRLDFGHVEVVANGVDKRVDTAMALASSVAARGATEIIVAIGGGRVLDIAGFVAHVVRRGIPHVVVPTTLLGMIDAAHGGKNAVDAGGVRNALGTVHLPLSTIIDVGFLSTLPVEERVAGANEGFKVAFIASDAPVDGTPAVVDDMLHRLLDPSARVTDHEAAIRHLCAFKRAVVDDDLWDRGPRRALNFGHTLGHALESASGFQVRHGDAVGRGMRAAIALSQRRGLLDVEVSRALVARLPPSPPLPDGTWIDELPLRAARADKKRDGTTVNMVLLVAPGKPVLLPVDDDELRFAWDVAVGTEDT